MISFDYITEARSIRDMLGDDQVNLKTNINDAIRSGSTGAKILMALRWRLLEYLKTNPNMSESLSIRINIFIKNANMLLE
jgi:hypothetical protein